MKSESEGPMIADALQRKRPHDANCGDCDMAEFAGTTYESVHRCHAANGPMRCDRERGHDGDHRGYNDQIDEPMFWSDHALCPDCGGGWTFDFIARRIYCRTCEAK